MNSKITGFILSPTPTDFLPAINPMIRRKTISGPWGHLTLFSTGNDIEAVEPGVWSLGFPPHTSLMDHNLLIRVTDEGVTIENDWLASIPVYFNEKEKIISTFPEVCLTEDTELNEEGMFLYLKYGFSAFGTTPFRSVQSLRYFSSLTCNRKRITLTEKPDPLTSLELSKPAGESEIINDLGRHINQAIGETSGPVISPISGGIDSRLINFLIEEHHKPRIHTYSYGVSTNQRRSFETEIGRKVAHALNLKWQHIPLQYAYENIHSWHDLYGFATHIHGMYQIEFYQRIKESLAPEEPAMMISGIGGSVFEGDHLSGIKAKSPDDLYKLAFTHNLSCANKYMIETPSPTEKQFFDNNRALLQEEKYFSVLMMRIKLPLLSYLTTVPAVMGIPSTAPFLNFETAVKMLSLPQHRRKERTWLKEFFTNHDLNFGTRCRHGDTRNTLNYYLFRNHTFQPLHEEPLQPYISKSEIRKINKYLKQANSFFPRIRYFLTSQRVIKEVLKIAGINNRFNKHLNCWATLKAIEKSVFKKSSGK